MPQPGPNEVLARVRAVSICGTDAHLIRGDYPGFWPPAFPFTPGHEWAGEIVALGPGAERFGWSIGDRVAGTSHDACGVCRECVEGRYNLCAELRRARPPPPVRTQHPGRRRDLRRPRRQVHLPPARRLTFEDGALVDPASIALHVANRGNITPGDTVAITGAGAIGLLAGDAARIRGAARVIVVGRGQRLAKACRARFRNRRLDGRRPRRRGARDDRRSRRRRRPRVRRRPGGHRVGARDAAARRSLCRRRHPHPGVEIAMQKLVLDELELVGSRASAGEMRRVIPHVEQGRMRVRELVTHRFALADYADALATFNDRASGAIKIDRRPLIRRSRSRQACRSDGEASPVQRRAGRRPR